MKNLVKIVFVAIILISCNKKDKGFIINGRIEGIEDKSLIILYDSEYIKLDSTFSKNDKFTFTGKVNVPSEYYLQYKDEGAYIWIENVKIDFKSKFPKIESNCIIKGGKEQELSNIVTKITLPYIKKIEEVSALFNKGKFSNEIEVQELSKELNVALENLDKTLINFGKKHYNSYVGLDILYRTREHIAKDSLIYIYEKLSPELKQSKSTKALRVFLHKNIAEIGKPFIDFEAKTIDGENFKLSSLKGKYIYLSFWSYGCLACRKENKFLSENYNKMPKDLSIVSFSTSKNATNWINASKEDNIFWTNISDSEGGKGKVKTLYNVQSLPTSYFINKEGIIIKKFIGFGDGDMLINEFNKLIEENK